MVGDLVVMYAEKAKNEAGRSRLRELVGRPGGRRRVFYLLSETAGGLTLPRVVNLALGGEYVLS